MGGSSESTGWAEVRQQLPGMEAAHITTFGNAARGKVWHGNSKGKVKVREDKTQLYSFFQTYAL